MKILIIDSNNCMHRALHSYARLQNHGKPVSIIYGMPILVNGLINQFKPDDVYMCWDGHTDISGFRSPHRLKLCPGYKMGRKTKTLEERQSMYHQKNEVMKLFHTLGVKQIFNPKMEADDYIYMLVRKLLKDKENKITIISTDKDFHQLVGKRVKIYNTASRKLIHLKNLKFEYGYEPWDCVDYLCLTGDDSDNIDGMPGIGPKKAQGLIQEFGSIKDFLKQKEDFARINKETLTRVYRINKQLIDLKLFYKKYLKGKVKINYFKDNANPKLDKASLFRICKEYSIKSLKEKNFLRNYDRDLRA